MKSAEYRAEMVFSSMYGAVKELIPQGNHYVVKGYLPLYGDTMNIGHKVNIGYITLKVNLWLYDWFSVIEFPRGGGIGFQWPLIPGLPHLRVPSRALIVREEDGDEWPAYIDIDRAYIAALKYIGSGVHQVFHEKVIKLRGNNDAITYDLLDKNPPHNMIEPISWRLAERPTNIEALAFKPLEVK